MTQVDPFTGTIYVRCVHWTMASCSSRFRSRLLSGYSIWHVFWRRLWPVKCRRIKNWCLHICSQSFLRCSGFRCWRWVACLRNQTRSENFFPIDLLIHFHFIGPQWQKNERRTTIFCDSCPDHQLSGFWATHNSPEWSLKRACSHSRSFQSSHLVVSFHYPEYFFSFHFVHSQFFTREY